jgi:thiamine biosynthesis protein ThiS
MTVFLNGKKRDFAPEATLSSLLAEKGLKPAQVVIELNQEIIDRSGYGKTFLNENDVVEILEFVGGG